MNASVPSLLHSIWVKLEENLDILRELSRTWPIAAMFLELFQTIVNKVQFDKALSLAIEGCRKRVYGDETSDDQSRPRKAFKRTTAKQVVLPENRVILQVLQRGSQKRHPLPPSSHRSASANQEVEPVPETQLLDFAPGNTSSMALDEMGFSWENADPSIVLQSMHEFARTGELTTRSTNDVP